jgi:DNA-binding response OmpR family regulator
MTHSEALAKIADLEAELQALRDYMQPPGWMLFPLAWGLREAEAKILNLILLREVVSREQIMDCLYFDTPNPPDDGIIKVRICGLRKRLDQFGIEIDTHWYSKAYSMTASNKSKLRSLMTPLEIAA